MGVTEREMKREERVRNLRQDRKDRTERERQRGARCKEMKETEEGGSVYSDTSHCLCCAWQKRNA